MNFVEYWCPDGYHFEGSNNVTHYSLCHNWEWVQDFDPTAKCLRKSTKLVYFLFV